MSLAYSKWCLLGLVGFARIFVQSSMSAVAFLTSRDGCSTSTCTNLGSFRSKRLACAPYLIGQVWIFVSLSHRHEHHHSLRLADRSAVKPSLRRPFLIGFLNFAEVSFWLGKVCTVRKIDQNLANTYARENVITRHHTSSPFADDVKISDPLPNQCHNRSNWFQWWATSEYFEVSILVMSCLPQQPNFWPDVLMWSLWCGEWLSICYIVEGL